LEIGPICATSFADGRSLLCAMLEIDGSQGEGGGQVLRTSLSLSALTGRPFRLVNIRAGRSKPGLRPQHVTAVRAAAAICQAEVSGAALNSHTLTFTPQAAPQGGAYTFDVAQAAQGGSAGSMTLILQTVLWPLLFAERPSQVILRGGTHVPFSPTFHYLAETAGPAFTRLGAAFSVKLNAWGWYPAGGGEMQIDISPIGKLQAVSWQAAPRDHVQGIAAVTNLPAHIPQRMANRAHNLLAEAGLKAHITPLRASGPTPGAGLVLWLPQAGFSSLGRQGVPAERVAETAVAEMLAFVDNGSDVDKRLADQLLLPLVLANGRSHFTTNELTLHTLTNAALLRQWLGVDIEIDGELGKRGSVQTEGISFSGD
jgi:RNA 3'-terminal phosphate cyclase (ATP)